MDQADERGKNDEENVTEDFHIDNVREKQKHNIGKDQ